MEKLAQKDQVKSGLEFSFSDISAFPYSGLLLFKEALSELVEQPDEPK